MTTDCDWFERHRSCLHMSSKFTIAFEQGPGAFVSFQNHFYALEKKKAFEEDSSVGCRKKCSSLEAPIDNKLQRKLVRDVPIQKSFRVPQKN